MAQAEVYGIFGSIYSLYKMSVCLSLIYIFFAFLLLETRAYYSIMKILTRVKMPSNKQQITVLCPDLTAQQLVPSKIVITESSGSEEVPVKDIACKVVGGGTELYNYAESYFHIGNELDLSPCMYAIEKSGKVELQITNRSRDVKNLAVYTEYIHSLGGIIYQDRLDHFEDVLKNIHKSGRCTKLILSFSRSVDDIQFATTAECVDQPDSWISSFNIITEPGDDDIYALDCAGEMYAKYFDFMQLQVIDGATEEVRRLEPLNLYVLAYGFPHGRS